MTAADAISVLVHHQIMEQASKLLAGHTDLLYRFNRFLPDGYRIEPLPYASPIISTARSPPQSPSLRPSPWQRRRP